MQTKTVTFAYFFVIFLIYWSLELTKQGDPLFLNLIFTYFPIMNSSRKFKEFHRQDFIASYLLNIELKQLLFLLSIDKSSQRHNIMALPSWSLSTGKGVLNLSTSNWQTGKFSSVLVSAIIKISTLRFDLIWKQIYFISYGIYVNVDNFQYFGV